MRPLEKASAHPLFIIIHHHRDRRATSPYARAGQSRGSRGWAVARMCLRGRHAGDAEDSE